MTTYQRVAPYQVSRVFNAPRELLWKANMEPDRMAKWFASEGTNSFVKNMEFRPGGICHYCQRSLDGHETWGIMTYEAIKPMERLMYIQSFSDAEGNIVAHPMASMWPKYMRSVVVFEDLGKDQSRMTIEWTPHNASAEEKQMFDSARAGMDQGWKGTLDMLEAYLKKEQSV